MLISNWTTFNFAHDLIDTKLFFYYLLHKKHTYEILLHHFSQYTAVWSFGYKVYKKKIQTHKHWSWKFEFFIPFFLEVFRSQKHEILICLWIYALLVYCSCSPLLTHLLILVEIWKILSSLRGKSKNDECDGNSWIFVHQDFTTV